MKKLSILASICLLLFAACKAPQSASKEAQTTSTEQKGPKGKLVPLVLSEVKRYSITPAEFQQLQYVLHGSISIEGTFVARQKTIENGELVLSSDKDHLGHLVSNGTNGVLDHIDGGALWIKFDQNGTSRNFKFAPGRDGLYFFTPPQEGVLFDGQRYAYAPESRQAYLQIYVLNQENQKSKTTQAPGIIIGSGGNEESAPSGYSSPNYSVPTPTEPLPTQTNPSPGTTSGKKKIVTPR